MKVLVLNPSSSVTKNVVRDLIYGCWCKGKRIGGTQAPPLNLLYVATVLKKQGHHVRFFDALGERKGMADIKRAAQGMDVVVISTSTMSFKEDISILKELKRSNPCLKTIIFGSHPTFMPEYALDNDVVDIAVQRDGKLKINKPYPFIENLDELPFPDRTLLPKDVDYFNPVVKKTPYTTMMTSRGCPGRCTFCTVPFFYGDKVRSRSTENILDEIRLAKKQGYKDIWFRDETFTFFRKRNEELCHELIKQKLGIKWMCNARVGTVTKEMMILMKKAGCHMIKFGVESGNQQILNNSKKGILADMTRKTFKWANKVGMETHAHMMLGMPGETFSTAMQSIRFAKEINPTTVTFGVCTPYAGTELFDQVKKKDASIADGSSVNLSKVHTTGYYNKHYTSLTDKELQALIRKAYKQFYFRPSYLLKKLFSMKNLDELKRNIVAGLKIFEFGSKMGD